MTDLKKLSVRLGSGQVVTILDHGDGIFSGTASGFLGTARLEAEAAGQALAIEIATRNYKQHRAEAEYKKTQSEAAKKLRKKFDWNGEQIDTIEKFDAIVADLVKKAGMPGYLKREGIYVDGINKKVAALFKKDGVEVHTDRIKDARKRLKND
jgi:hypothetical protein